MKNYIVILDSEQTPISMLEAETFVLFLLRQGEGVEVHQTDHKNLLHLEACAQTIAAAFRQSDQAPYQLIGELIQRVMTRARDMNAAALSS